MPAAAEVAAVVDAGLASVAVVAVVGGRTPVAAGLAVHIGIEVESQYTAAEEEPAADIRSVVVVGNQSAVRSRGKRPVVVSLAAALERYHLAAAVLGHRS